VSLIISDVLGDPLDVIASGPTVEDTGTPQAALDVLERFDARRAGIPATVFDYLRQQCELGTSPEIPFLADRVTNIILGNNAVAVDAAGMEAERRGYSHAMTAAARPEGAAEVIGRHHADMSLRMRDQAGPDCLITGGEPTVSLVPAAERGLGGRNQQLVLAALDRLRERRIDARDDRPLCEGIVLLSGGTDGEDGPTDAAGAWIDAIAAGLMQSRRLKPGEFLRRNDAYHFFEPLGTLIKTGPTHTNVCDLRVVVVDRVEQR
jgi:hydroxypyruvate reductase